MVVSGFKVGKWKGSTFAQGQILWVDAVADAARVIEGGLQPGTPPDSRLVPPPKLGPSLSAVMASAVLTLAHDLERGDTVLLRDWPLYDAQYQDAMRPNAVRRVHFDAVVLAAFDRIQAAMTRRGLTVREAYRTGRGGFNRKRLIGIAMLYAAAKLHD